MLILNSWGFQLLRIIDTMKGHLGGRLVYKTEQHKTNNGGVDSQVISVMVECIAGHKVGDKF